MAALDRGVAEMRLVVGNEVDEKVLRHFLGLAKGHVTGALNR